MQLRGAAALPLSRVRRLPTTEHLVDSPRLGSIFAAADQEGYGEETRCAVSQMSRVKSGIGACNC